MNNKGMIKVFGMILGFSFLILTIFFAVFFLKDVGKTEILDRIDNYTLNVEDDLGLSSEMKTHVHEFPDEYNNLDVPYDLYFIVMFLTMFVSTIMLSIKTKEESMLSFLGLITFGVIFLLFLTSFINAINEWFILNFFNGFLSIDLNNVPILNYYISNLGIINLIWASILLLANKLNFVNKREEDNVITDNGGFER